MIDKITGSIFGKGNMQGEDANLYSVITGAALFICFSVIIVGMYYAMRYQDYEATYVILARWFPHWPTTAVTIGALLPTAFEVVLFFMSATMRRVPAMRYILFMGIVASIFDVVTDTIWAHDTLGQLEQMGAGGWLIALVSGSFFALMTEMIVIGVLMGIIRYCQDFLAFLWFVSDALVAGLNSIKTIRSNRAQQGAK